MPYSRFHARQDDAVSVWIYVGGFSLTFLAGFINVSMLYVFSAPVSHMSGAVSRIGIDIGADKYSDLRQIILIIGCFFLGAMFSGYVIASNRLTKPHPYHLVLGSECLALLVAAMTISTSANTSVACSALACGMQNAMASSYHGLIIRTTHVTGMVTDLGFMFGSFFRTGRLQSWKIALLGILVGGYCCGGVVSALCQRTIGHSSAFIAFGICLLITAGHFMLIMKSKI